MKKLLFSPITAGFVLALLMFPHIGERIDTQLDDCPRCCRGR